MKFLEIKHDRFSAAERGATGAESQASV